MIIPIYNKEKSLETTLNSIIANHGKCSFECFLIDDSSTDSSTEIAMRFEREYPELFTYFRIQHKGKYGPANARNMGIKFTDSEYTCFLDADDELLPGHLDRCVEYLNTHKAYDIYGESHVLRDYTSDTENGEIILQERKVEFNNSILYDLKQIYKDKSFPNFAACVYRTELVKSNPFLDCICEDQVFLFNLMHRSRRFLIETGATGFIYNTQFSDVSVKSNETHGVNTQWKDNYVVMYIDILNKINPDYPLYLKWHKEGDLDCWQLCEREYQ